MTGPVELKIKFFDAATGGNQLGPEVDDQNVSLSGGVFQAPIALDGPAFAQIFGTSSQAFVEVTDVTHSTTYPRQSFSAVPYALRVPVDAATIAYDGNGNLTLVSPDKVSSAGGSMSGSLTMTGGATVTGIPSPVNPDDAVNKSYADSIGSTLTGEIAGKISSQWTTNGSAISYSSGSVAVGTTSPGAMLEVDGSVKIADGTQGLGKVLTSDGAGLASWQTVSGASQWTTNGSDIYFGAGDVGIGTTSPSHALEVHSASSATIAVTDGADSSVGWLGISTNNGGYLELHDKTGTAQAKLRGFAVSGIQGYFDAGNIGIGTSVPANLLDVNGAVAVGAFAGTAAPADTLIVGGNVGIGVTSPGAKLEVDGGIMLSSGSGGVITFPDGTTQSTAAAGVSANWGGGVLDNVGSLSIGTTTPGTDLYFGSGNRTESVQSVASGAGGSLTIQAGGTTGSNQSGGNLILASGASNGTGTSQIQLQTANGGTTTNALTILGDGDVGIGTTSPSSLLTVKATAGATTPITVTDDTGLRIFTLAKNSAEAATAELWNNNDQSVRVHLDATGGGNYFTGDVGIGTSSPGQNLQIGDGSLPSAPSTNGVIRLGANHGASYRQWDLGTSQTTAPYNFYIEDLQMGTPALTIGYATGDVAIGTTAPGATLEIYQSGTGTRGLLLAGAGINGGTDSNGIIFTSGFNAAGNRQLWLTDSARYGNSVYNSFRYVVGFDVPEIDAVSNDGVNRRSITLGAQDTNVGVGFDVTKITQSNITAKLHVHGGGTGTNPTFLAEDSSGNALFMVEDGGNVGIGTTSPSAALDVNGHIAASATGTPTLSSCGTSPSITGNDTRGQVVIGGGATSCTLSFAVSYTSAPYCIATSTSTVVTVAVTSVSITQLVIGSSAASPTVYYQCLQ